jgi:pilus assembly protein Flp/PilA
MIGNTIERALTDAGYRGHHGGPLCIDALTLTELISRSVAIFNKGYIDSAQFSLNMLVLQCFHRPWGQKRGSLVVTKVFKLLNEVRKDEEGVTMAEYAILIGLIAVVSIGIVKTVGTDILNIFTQVSTNLANVT